MKSKKTYYETFPDVKRVIHNKAYTIVVIDADVEGADQSWESLVKGTYSAIRLVRNSFTIVGGIMNAMAREIGIPLIFVYSATTILLVSIIFSIIYLIFRFKG